MSVIMVFNNVYLGLIFAKKEKICDSNRCKITYKVYWSTTNMLKILHFPAGSFEDVFVLDIKLAAKTWSILGKMFGLFN